MLNIQWEEPRPLRQAKENEPDISVIAKFRIQTDNIRNTTPLLSVLPLTILHHFAEGAVEHRHYDVFKKKTK